MYFHHLYAKGVKLSDLGAMQRYRAAPTSLRTANSVQKNHSIEDLTPVKLNARVKEQIDLREQYCLDAVHFFQEKYGKENVLYCMCHVNESNPHVHIGIPPITSFKSNYLEEVKSHLEELKSKLKVLVENLDGSEQKI